MTYRNKRKTIQGYLLIEALVSMLVFAFGVLGLVALYTNMIARSQDAIYRVNATMAATELLSMLTVDGNNAGCYLMPTAGACANPTSTTYRNDWLSDVNIRFPGSTQNQPTVSVAGDNRVTITIFWQRDGDPTLHNYTLVGQL